MVEIATPVASQATPEAPVTPASQPGAAASVLADKVVGDARGLSNIPTIDVTSEGLIAELESNATSPEFPTDKRIEVVNLVAMLRAQIQTTTQALQQVAAQALGQGLLNKEQAAKYIPDQTAAPAQPANAETAKTDIAAILAGAAASPLAKPGENLATPSTIVPADEPLAVSPTVPHIAGDHHHLHNPNHYKGHHTRAIQAAKGAKQVLG